MSSKVNQAYLRSAIFGLEDGLVSTTGTVVGIATGIADKQVVVLAGLVVVAVEALSMAAGQYLSEKSSHQLEKGSAEMSILIKGALIMFFTYILGGLVPILPILLLPLSSALINAVIFALIGLFAVGYLAGKIVKVNPFYNAIEMLIIGGAATLLGVVVGYLLKI